MREDASGPVGGVRPAGSDRSSVAKDDRSWRIRNWPLRRKLTAVLLVPLIAAMAFGGLRVADEVNSAQELDRTSKRVELGQRSASVIFELQREREVVGAWIQEGRSPAGRGALDAQTAATDRAVDGLRAAGDLADSLSPQVKGLYEQALDRVDSVRVLREVASNSRFSPTSTVRSYEDVIGMLLQLERSSAQGLSDPDLSAEANAVDVLARAREYAGQENTLMRVAARANAFPYSDLDTMREAGSRYTAAITQYKNQAPAEQVQRFSNTVAGSDVDERQRLQQIALIRGGNAERLNLPPAEVDRVSAATLELLRQSEADLQAQVKQAADSAASTAWTNAVRDGAIVALVLAVAVATTIVVARSLTRPLERLRRSAEEVAGDRLPSAVDHLRQAKGEVSLGQLQPEQVQVFTREEIGEVARSFDEVHSQALRLASEQALLRNNINDLFVNLARRSQTLVQRQLSVIDRLEQDEQDPDQLSSLFELDHLATRMRRNSENLLILGGTDLTRRMMRPVPLSEVVGAAVSEVEQYTRVSVPDPPDLAVQGRVVNDFVHLLAELLENATVFSNPDTEVSVQTAYRRQTLVLEIRDRGVGIDSAELAEINDRLVRLPDVDVAISRRMGLYVVGQLARRHNIEVELRNNTDLEGGITATVQVSGEYVVQLTEDGPKPMPDVQPSPEPRGDAQRSALSDSGSHPGLAAAFQRGGFGDRGPAEAPTERSPLDGDVSAEDPTRRAMPSPGPDAAAWRGPQPQEESAWEQEPARQEDPAWGEGPTWQEDVAESGAGFGHDPAEAAEQDWPAEQPWPQEQPWPGAGDADDLSREGVPGDGVSGDGVPGDEVLRAEGPRDEGAAEPEPDLFHSPFEAQKTSEFTAVGPDWPSGGAGAPEAPDWGAPAEDEPTQRLPIYEAVLSQWFRESDANDPAGGEGTRSAMSSDLAATGSQRTSTPEDFREFAGDGEDEGADDDRVTVDGTSDGAVSEGTAGEGASAGDTGGAADHGARNGSARSATAASVVGGRARARAERERSEQAPAPDDAEQPGQPDPGWGSADAGWEAAEALVEPSQQAQSTTSAGLPKRVPQSNLVPGSAASQQPETPAKPATPRSADAVRGRMSNFQSGIRRGRHAKAEPDPAEPDPTEQQSRPNPSRPEEQE